jgi:hypothetical protein
MANVGHGPEKIQWNRQIPGGSGSLTGRSTGVTKTFNGFMQLSVKICTKFPLAGAGVYVLGATAASAVDAIDRLIIPL